MIASKQGDAEPEMFNATKSVIRVEKSGALSILKTGLKDEGIYEISITYNKGITLSDEVEIKIQGDVKYYILSDLLNIKLFWYKFGLQCTCCSVVLDI